MAPGCSLFVGLDGYAGGEPAASDADASDGSSLDAGQDGDAIRRPTSDADSAISTEAITIGQAEIVGGADQGNGNLLVAQEASLPREAIIRSLSFYVTAASGDLRLAIYDATGPSGGPGGKQAETSSFTPVVGWNTAEVATPVLLTPGAYWLAYLPSSNGLGFRKTESGKGAWSGFDYGPMPSTFSPTPSTGAVHWSFYATLHLP